MYRYAAAFHALAAPDIDLRVAQVERPGPLGRVADVVAVAADLFDLDLREVAVQRKIAAAEEQWLELEMLREQIGGNQAVNS